MPNYYSRFSFELGRDEHTPEQIAILVTLLGEQFIDEDGDEVNQGFEFEHNVENNILSIYTNSDGGNVHRTCAWIAGLSCAQPLRFRGAPGGARLTQSG